MAKKNLRQLNYRRIAKLDTDMWRAYYSHRFFRLFLLLLQLMRTQFQFGFISALRAAYYAGIAATGYRIRKGHENFSGVQRNLEKFYSLISDNSMEPFDYRKAAEIELEWWNIHRYAERYEKALEVSLAEGMAIIYNGKPKDFLEYGRLRAQAMLLRDEMGDVQRTEPDWKKIESLLLDSWKSMHEAVQAK
jgi:hypothetical protein